MQLNQKTPNSTNAETKFAVMTNSRKENGRAKVCDQKEHRATLGRLARSLLGIENILVNELSV